VAVARRLVDALRASVWLGWQISANWTDLLVFSTYTLIRPIFSMLIFIFMYLASAATGGADPSKLSYILVGSALLNYFVNSNWESFIAVHEDREHYQTIRYLYLASPNLALFYIGRNLAPVMFNSTVSLLVNLTVGVSLFGVRISPTPSSIVALAISVPIVAVGFLSYSMITASIGFVTSRYIWGMIEGVSGLIFLFSGVMFPPELLPPELAWVAKLVPWSYWVELLRSPLMGIQPTMSSIGAGLVASLGMVLLGAITFRWSLSKAKRDGTLDTTINW